MSETDKIKLRQAVQCVTLPGNARRQSGFRSWNALFEGFSLGSCNSLTLRRWFFPFTGRVWAGGLYVHYTRTQRFPRRAPASSFRQNRVLYQQFYFQQVQQLQNRILPQASSSMVMTDFYLVDFYGIASKHCILHCKQSNFTQKNLQRQIVPCPAILSPNFQHFVSKSQAKNHFSRHYFLTKRMAQPLNSRQRQPFLK